MKYDGYLRLSVQTLHNPIVARLSDRHFRRYIECQMLAVGNGGTGWLPDIKDAAWILRLPVDELESDLQVLFSAGLVTVGIDGDNDNPLWYVPGIARPPMTQRDITRYQFNRKRKDVYRQLVERDGEYCQYCGDTHNLSVDHVLAIANGGGNEMDNFQLLCRSCNSRKGAR